MTRTPKGHEVRLAIMKLPDLTPAAMLVAIRLYDLQGRRTGFCTLGRAALAEDCGCSPNLVKKAFAQLRSMGLLETVPTEAGRVAHRRLLVEALVERTRVHADPGPGSSVDRVPGDPGTSVPGARVQTDPGIPEAKEELMGGDPPPTPPAVPEPDPPWVVEMMRGNALVSLSEVAMKRAVESRPGATWVKSDRDRPLHLAVGTAVTEWSAKRGETPEAAMQRLAARWLSLAEKLTANSWKTFVVDELAGRPWTGKRRKGCDWMKPGTGAGFSDGSDDEEGGLLAHG